MLKIVIPCWNSVELTEMCVESLYKNTTNKFELIIIDDHSTDGTVKYTYDLTRGYKVDNIKVLRNTENLGTNYSWNRGVELAGKENTIIISNNDVIFSPGWDVPLLKAIEDGASIASPFHINTLNERDLFEKGLPEKWWELDRFHENGGFPITGSCFVCRPNLFNDVGLFDERLRNWCGDNQLVAACNEKGYKMVHVPESKIVHLYSRTIQYVPPASLNADVELFNNVIKPEKGW